MTNMRKFLAGLTAVCCMAGAMAMTASAESELGFLDNNGTYETTAQGNVFYSMGKHKIGTMVIVTDGTEPSAEDMQAEVLGQTFTLYEDVAEVTFGRDTYTDADGNVHDSIATSYMSDALKEQLAQYGENAKLYYVHINREFRSNYYMLARKFMLENDYVLDILEMTIDSYGEGVWNGGMTCHFRNDGDSDAQTSRFEEILTICGMNEARATYLEWRDAYNSWEASVDIENMTADEIAASREAAGLMTDAEINALGYNVAKTAMAEFGTELDSIAPDISFHYIDHYYYADNKSLWANAGDFNKSSGVDANDAAEILKYTAELGTSASTSLQEGQRDAGDVNCDGYVNAQDAASVLQYAAAAGTTDAEVSWAEILRK